MLISTDKLKIFLFFGKYVIIILGCDRLMDSNLMVYDMDNFVNKYTRFMTKDIYISNKMYSNFLKQYDYLYQILKRDRFLYNDNKKFKKIRDISINKGGLIKLHNQKYLQGALKKYESFFEGILVRAKLDNRKKMIILSEEESTYVVGDKNYDSLIVGKLKYLIDCKNYDNNSILVLTANGGDVSLLKEGCSNNGIDVNIMTISDYGRKMLRGEQVVDDCRRYDILIEYIMKELFPNKDKFKSFYKAFSKYIYLNKDYTDYETFRDYHNYMYKRKFLASKLSLKKFNEHEILKRKNYLRTIKNESLKYKDEIDIANFLYLNSITYIYDNDKSLFKIELLGKETLIRYVNNSEVLKDNYLDNIIYLYSSYSDDKTYLSVLVYELIKRRYPLELVDDERLYTELRNNCVDNYFSEFCTKYLIPLIKYYEDNKELNCINISELGKEEFFNLYKYYDRYLKKFNLITENNLLRRIEQEIVKDKYKYLFLIGDVTIKVDIPNFTIVDDYQETELIKENIKLLYDYKKYLYENGSVPIMHTYLDKKEINTLTRSFLKDNLMIINKSLEEMVKEVKICVYDDSNRVYVYRNIGECCSNILVNKENTLLAFRNLKDINILIGSNKFTKLDKDTLLTKDKEKIKVGEILKIDKLYNTIILPYLIKDDYHDELFKDDYQYNIKVMLYVALSKCRDNLIILCPSSRSIELNMILGNLKKQMINS